MMCDTNTNQKKTSHINIRQRKQKKQTYQNEGHRTMIKELNYQQDLAIIHMYAPIPKASKYPEQNQYKQKGNPQWYLKTKTLLSTTDKEKPENQKEDKGAMHTVS